MSISWWRRGKGKRISKVSRLHHLPTVNAFTKFSANLVDEIYKWIHKSFDLPTAADEKTEGHEIPPMDTMNIVCHFRQQS